jgi:hypothetical protein
MLDPDGFYISMPIPNDLREKCLLVYGRTKYRSHWSVFGLLHEYFRTIDMTCLGAFESRCESFDLVCENPWVCFAINPFDDVDDETKVLLLLKYNMSEQPRVIKQK